MEKKQDKADHTYSTSQIAKIVGVHPNTVRMYEEWGLIQKPRRKENGYRVFGDIHIKQFALAKKALQIPILQAGLRKKIMDAVKLSALYRFEDAKRLVDEYIQVAAMEIEHAKEAAALTQTLYEQQNETGKTYKRAEAAKELGLSIDTIRNWEMNGLITVKRKDSGYRIYDENDMNRLRIIRSLRCANYSLSAILRMLSKLEIQQGNKDCDIYNLLNTPEDGEDILYVCDQLVVSLESAIQNAKEVLNILDEIKQIKK